MFDLDLKLARVDTEAEKKKKRIRFIHKLSLEIEAVIPEGWTLYPDYGFELANYSHPPAAEFRTVCSILDAALGKPLYRSGDSDGDLCGSLYHEDKASQETIHITVRSGRPPDCKVTWKETKTKVAIVDPACLGIHPEPTEPKPAPEA